MYISTTAIVLAVIFFFAFVALLIIEDALDAFRKSHAVRLDFVALMAHSISELHAKGYSQDEIERLLVISEVRPAERALLVHYISGEQQMDTAGYLKALALINE